MKIIYLQVSDEIKKSIEDFITTWENPDDFITTYTSGSTGKPKAIKILKSKMRESAQMTGEYLNIKKNDRALVCLPVNTIAGKMMIVRALVLNLQLFVGSVNSNPLLNIDEEIDFIAMVPLQLHNALIECPDRIKKIRNVIIGGGPISTFSCDKLKENGITVFHTYGMTETISHVAMRRVGLKNDETFCAIGLTTFSEINSQLVIHSPLLLTKTITTNDYIQLIDSKHFKLKGRADFVINSGGVKIHPEEIENKLSSMMSLPFFISSLEDGYFGEKVIICIESLETISISKIKILEVLTKYECPKEVYFLPKFEMTESGKINRLKTISKINSKTSVVYL